MGDEMTADDIQGMTSSDALGATADDTQDVTAQTDGQGSDDQDTTEAIRDRKLARENASLRKRLREIEADKRARDEAELSEQEKTQRRMVEMEQALEATRSQMRTARLSASISTEAAKFGIVDVDAATRLLDTSALDYDEEQGWDGIADALQALTVERPWLVQTGTAPALDANPANPARRRSRVTREQLGRMTQAEIDALPWEDVQAALSER